MGFNKIKPLATPLNTQWEQQTTTATQLQSGHWNKWASSRQNLSSGFPTKWDSNQSPHLQRLARELKIRCLDMVLFKKRLTKALISLRGCQPPKTGFLASWPLMMAVLSRNALIYECMYYSLTLYIRVWIENSVRKAWISWSDATFNRIRSGFALFAYVQRKGCKAYVSLSLSHWYPWSGVVLDCIDSWSLHPYLLFLLVNSLCIYPLVCL